MSQISFFDSSDFDAKQVECLRSHHIFWKIHSNLIILVGKES
jgi:hypothetical protein